MSCSRFCPRPLRRRQHPLTVYQFDHEESGGMGGCVYCSIALGRAIVEGWGGTLRELRANQNALKRAAYDLRKDLANLVSGRRGDRFRKLITEKYRYNIDDWVGYVENLRNNRDEVGAGPQELILLPYLIKRPIRLYQLAEEAGLPNPTGKGHVVYCEYGFDMKSIRNKEPIRLRIVDNHCHAQLLIKIDTESYSGELYDDIPYASYHMTEGEEARAQMRRERRGGAVRAERIPGDLSFAGISHAVVDGFSGIIDFFREHPIAKWSFLIGFTALFIFILVMADKKNLGGSKEESPDSVDEPTTPPGQGGPDCWGGWSDISGCKKVNGLDIYTAKFNVSNQGTEDGKKCTYKDGVTYWFFCDNNIVGNYPDDPYGYKGVEVDEPTTPPTSPRTGPPTNSDNCVGDWEEVAGATCSVKCGGGTIQEVYKISKQSQNSGQACPNEDGDTRNTKVCNTQNCGTMQKVKV